MGESIGMEHKGHETIIHDHDRLGEHGRVADIPNSEWGDLIQMSACRPHI